MRRQPLLFISVVALGIGMVTGVGIVNAPNACAAEEAVSFKEDILPLLKWRCASVPRTGRRRLRTERVGFNELRRGDERTKFGRMVIPREPESSNLMLLLDWRAAPALRMPHGKKQLSSCD